MEEMTLPAIPEPLRSATLRSPRPLKGETPAHYLIKDFTVITDVTMATKIKSLRHGRILRHALTFSPSLTRPTCLFITP